MNTENTLEKGIEIPLTNPDSKKLAETKTLGLYTFSMFQYDCFNFSVPESKFEEVCERLEEITMAALGKPSKSSYSQDDEDDDDSGSVSQFTLTTSKNTEEQARRVYNEKLSVLSQFDNSPETTVAYSCETKFNMPHKNLASQISSHSGNAIADVVAGISKFTSWNTFAASTPDNMDIEIAKGENIQSVIREYKSRKFINRFIKENPIPKDISEEEFTTNLVNEKFPLLLPDTALNDKLDIVRLRFNVYFRLVAMLISDLPVTLINSPIKLGMEFEDEKDIDWEKVEYEDVKIRYTGIIEQRACVSTDGIFFDRRFLSNITDGRAGFIYMHETLHVALMHLFRHGSQSVYESLRSMIVEYQHLSSSVYRNSRSKETETMDSMWLKTLVDTIERLRGYQNIAMDIPINAVCFKEQERLGKRSNSLQSAIIDCPDVASREWVYSSQLGNLLSEEIYALMEERQLPETNFTMDKHLSPNKSSAISSAARRKWENRIRRAIKEGGRGTGSTGSPAEDLLNKALEYISRVNYREKLRNEVTSEAGNRATWSKPNRRYIGIDTYLPAIVGNRLEVVFMADTSGSMGGYLEVIGSELMEICSTYESYSIHFYAVDTDICYQETITSEDGESMDFDRISKMLRGGGGTDFVSFFSKIEEEHHGKLVVALSDMEAGFPDYFTRDPLWLVPEEYESTLQQLRSERTGFDNYAILYDEHIRQED